MSKIKNNEAFEEELQQQEPLEMADEMEENEEEYEKDKSKAKRRKSDAHARHRRHKLRDDLKKADKFKKNLKNSKKHSGYHVDEMPKWSNKDQKKIEDMDEQQKEFDDEIQE